MVARGWACMVAPGGCAWLLRGCVVSLGGVHGCSQEHAWDTKRYTDTVNERAVCILLECILVQIRGLFTRNEIQPIAEIWIDIILYWRKEFHFKWVLNLNSVPLLSSGITQG